MKDTPGYVPNVDSYSSVQIIASNGVEVLRLGDNCLIFSGLASPFVAKVTAIYHNRSGARIRAQWYYRTTELAVNKPELCQVSLLK